MTQPPTTTRPSGKAYGDSNKGILAGGDDDFDRVIEEAFGIRGALRRRRKIIGAAIALLVVAGVGLTVALTDVGRGLLESASALVRRDGSRSSKAAPTAQRSPASAATPSSRANRRTALLSVTSTPRATLFIDGKRIGATPVGGHALTVGRTYQIRLEQNGYWAKRATLSVSNTKAISSHYVLTRAR
jgi:hypothetical protein